MRDECSNELFIHMLRLQHMTGRPPPRNIIRTWQNSKFSSHVTQNNAHASCLATRQKMAELDPSKVEAILQDYSETLEVLTINSKPLINDLTMAADRYKPLASQIVSRIESRLFEVLTYPSALFLEFMCVCVCISLFLYRILVCGKWP